MAKAGGSVRRTAAPGGADIARIASALGSRTLGTALDFGQEWLASRIAGATGSSIAKDIAKRAKRRRRAGTRSISRRVAVESLRGVGVPDNVIDFAMPVGTRVRRR